MTSNSTMQQPTEDFLKKIIDTTREIQDHAFNARSHKEFWEVLLESKLPVDKSEISIIYRSTNSNIPRFIVNRGEETYNKQHPDQQVPFPVDLKIITECLEGDGHHKYYPTEEECRKAGFKGYKSVLCIPMHLSNEKNIGVFITHSTTTENAYENIIYPLDILSDDLTFYIKSYEVHRRDIDLNELYNEILKDDSIDEIGIIKKINTELIKWFPSDDIYIFLVNSFNMDQYLPAVDKNVFDPSFRTKKIDNKKILSVASKATLEMMKEGIEKGEKGGLVLNSVQNIKEYSLEGDCKSWIAIPMQSRAEEVIGLIILQNHQFENAYDKEQVLFIEETALMLSVLWIRERDKQRKKLTHQFRNILVTKEYPAPGDLFCQVENELDILYGKVPFAIAHKIDPLSRDLKLKFCNIDNFELDKDLSDIIKSKLRDTESRMRYEISVDDLSAEHSVFGKLLITPMRLGGHGIGCFIVPIQRCGKLTARFIDELSDLVAVILDKHDEKNRLELLKEFGLEVSRMSSTDLSRDMVISLAHNYIAKAMYSKNLYIALYNNISNTISFPLILKDGKHWDTVDERNVNKKKRGKTEEIILTGNSLLHKTKKESLAWYSEKNHQEFAGDPLASWVGVPIFNASGVEGVIATYHAKEEHVYSEGDLFFLQMMSHHVSGLFRILELNAANSKLKKAQDDIIEREHLLASSLVAQDITHRLNNSLGSLGINISQAREDIEEALETKKINHLHETNDRILSDAAAVVNNLAGEVRLVANPASQEISVNDITSRIAEQVMIKNKLADKVFIYKDYPRSDIKMKVPYYRSLSNCLYELVENAGTALLDKLEQPILNEGLYLKIVIQKEKDFVLIDIIDNGVPIPENIKHKIFMRGESSKVNSDSGYGLWRAKALAHSIGGSLELLNSEPDIKAFRLKIPVVKECHPPLAFIIEDELSWRNIISRWLKEEGFELETADTLQSALKLFKNSKVKPQLVVLDISLNPLDSREVAGLSLINKAKKLSDDVKIVVLTGYKENALLYKEDIDLLVEKVKDGKFLTKNSFINQLKKINISSCLEQS